MSSLRFILPALLSLLATPAIADDASTIADAPPVTRSIADPPLSEGQRLGERLSAVGRLRVLGDDLDLAVSGLFAGRGADGFRAWRGLADTVAHAADAMPFHRLTLIAHAHPGRKGTVAEATERVEALRAALVTRGVPLDRMTIDVRPGRLDFEIRFERHAPVGQVKVPTVGAPETFLAWD